MATTTTTINYLIPFEESRIKLNPRMAGFKRQKFNPQPVTIHDTRGHEQDYSLDTHGFQIIKDPCPVPSAVFEDDEAVESTYYDHVVDLLKKELGCSKVYILTSKTREVTWNETLKSDADKPDDDTDGVQSGHLHFAHVDYSYDGAAAFVKRLVMTGRLTGNHRGRPLPTDEDMEQIKKSHWAMINYWQPIRHSVTRDPLAVCDARSVPEEDLFEDLPETIKEIKFFGTFYLKAPTNGGHKWYYHSDMGVDEALLIKCFDSKLDGRARRCPHTAFSGDKDHGPVRSSVEVRTLVCWEDEGPE